MDARPARYYLMRRARDGWRIATAAELQREGVLPLRGVDLGRARSVAEAERRAAAWMRDNAREAAMDAAGFTAWACAANVRAICEAHDGETDFATARLSGLRSRAGLKAEEVAAMLRGEAVEIEDAMGLATLGWRRVHRDEEN